MEGAKTLNVGGILWRIHGLHGLDGAIGGTPLVILHGLFGSGDNWQSQARALAGDAGGPRLVLVPDLPNHGDSLHTDQFSYPDLAARLWELIPEVLRVVHREETTVALLGHSMGGKIAMAMALERPDRVAGLIVVDIAPQRYAPRHQAILEGMRAVADAAPRTRREGERVLQEVIPEREIRLYLLKSLAPIGDGGTYQWKLNLDGIIRCYDTISDWPYTDAVYEGSALFVRGMESPYIAADGEDAIRRVFPAARIHPIENAGHWVHAEQREKFLSVVRTAVL